MSFRQSDEGTTSLPTASRESPDKVEILYSFAATFNTKYILCLGNIQNDKE